MIKFEQVSWITFSNWLQLASVNTVSLLLLMAAQSVCVGSYKKVEWSTKLIDLVQD